MHPHCGQHHLVGGAPGLNKKEKVSLSLHDWLPSSSEPELSHLFLAAQDNAFFPSQRVGRFATMSPCLVTSWIPWTFLSEGLPRIP